MFVERMPVGVLAANCYIIADEKNKKAAIIDPGGDAYKILAKVKEEGFDVEAIILTHGHADHIEASLELKEDTKAPIMVHSEDNEMLKDPAKNLSGRFCPELSFEADRILKSNEIIKIGDLELKVIHTPGHTKGGITISCENRLFTGDTLFQGSIGRTDLYGGDFDTLIKSIKKKLLSFSEDTLVLPGHGGESTIGHEKKRNPFLR